MSRDDTELIRRLRNRDLSAHNVLMNKYREYWVNYVRNKHSSLSNDAEDIVQEAFIVLLNKPDRIEHPEILGHWLFRIINNLCINQYRKKSPQLVDSTIESSDNTEETNRLFPDVVEKMDALARENFSQAVVEKELGDILAFLSESDRTVIYCFYWEGWKNEEIAEEISKKHNAIRTQKGRALKRLYVIYLYYFDFWTCEKIAKCMGESFRTIKTQLRHAYENFYERYYAALENLSERDREIRKLRFTEELSFQKIAKKKGMKITNVHKWFHHTQEQLKKEWMKQGISLRLINRIEMRKKIDKEGMF